MNRSTLIFILTIGYIMTCIWCKPNPSNHELLTRLGLQKVKAPNSHHRKRLAIESRQNGRSDDSHMFIIKLPPNPHYYVNNKPHDSKMKGKKVPIGFKSNGKPAKVYHWNIPVLKKIAAKYKQKSHNFDTKIHPNHINEILKPSKLSKTHKPSYYVPAKPKKSSFTKYFPGNGKPHSFYVIESNSRKGHYHRLLP